jgi:hypothetical protein
MKLLYLFALLIACQGLFAQHVGLGKGEITLLKNQLRAPGADSSLLGLYAHEQRLADQALWDHPDPIDTIRSEGLLQGNPKKTATQQSLQDMAKLYALALVYRVGGKRMYLRQALEYLAAWALVNHPRGDPIDDTNLDPAIEAFDMVKTRLPWHLARDVRRWLSATADSEITAVFNRPNRATSYNNWHSHRLKVIGEIAFALDDTALESYAIRGLKEQIGRNLRADGSSEDFVTRDALHYQVYDLEPLLKLAIVLSRATGVDYYTYVSAAGSSIRKSMDWLVPFATGEKTHAEFVNSTVEFDRRRARNGEAAYKAGSLWDPRNGVIALELAAFYDPAMMTTARTLSGQEGRYPGWQAVVNELVSATDQR